MWALPAIPAGLRNPCFQKASKLVPVHLAPFAGGWLAATQSLANATPFHTNVGAPHANLAPFWLVTLPPAAPPSRAPVPPTFLGSMPAARYVAAMVRVEARSSAGSCGTVMACKSTTQKNVSAKCVDRRGGSMLRARMCTRAGEGQAGAPNG